MPNQYFKFKQFTINQSHCAMKVGTDGVLLGAWANISNATNILDIGTGTGLIAIMLAQRVNTAKIHAVEVDADACNQALENIKECKWAANISLYNVLFQQFSKETTHKYNLVVSNPPYFINSLKTPNLARNLARHTDTLSHTHLLKGVSMLLAPDGIFAVIMPYTEGLIFVAQAASYKLFCNRKTYIKPKPNANANRILLEFAFKPLPIWEDTLVIHNNTDTGYTEKYMELTKAFYLNF